MKKLYGNNPLHLVAHIGLFALTAYAIVQIFTLGAAANAIVWLIAAVIVHDAVLWPLYSGADGAGRRLLGMGGTGINYVRVPLGLSLLLAIVFAPTVLNKGEGSYTRASGQEYDGYVTRWLVVSAAMFVISAIVFAVRRARQG
ncbi:MAG: hypothetical protein WKF94_00065 [Solirubrobacteraceae bacterium]